jgi:hypothetical protein
MLRLSKESPVFASGQSISLWICALPRILSRPSTSACLSTVQRRNHVSSIVVYWPTTVSVIGLPLSPKATTSLPLPYQAKILFSAAGILRCECFYTPAIFAATRRTVQIFRPPPIHPSIHPPRNNHPLQTTMAYHCTVCFQQGITWDFRSLSNMRSHLGASHRMGTYVCQVANCVRRTHRTYVYNDCTLQASG